LWLLQYERKKRENFKNWCYLCGSGFPAAIERIVVLGNPVSPTAMGLIFAENLSTPVKINVDSKVRFRYLDAETLSRNQPNAVMIRRR
jgi:hypothetical protein